jgi:hypothetical protein
MEGDDRQRAQPDDLDPALVAARDARRARLSQFHAQERARDMAAARGTVVTVPGNSTGLPRYGDVASTTVVMPNSGWLATAQPYTQAQVDEFTRDDGAHNVRAHQQMLRAQFPTEPRGKPKGSGRRRL